MTQPLIMLTGKLKSGKTTLAEALAAELDVKRDSFARPLKAGLKAMGLVVDGPNKDRFALQYFGADFFRKHYGADHWVKLMATNNLEMHRTGLIIDDCRFQNEFEWGKLNGFLTVRIKVSPITQIKRGALPEQLRHISETSLDPLPDTEFDLVFDENTSLRHRVSLITLALSQKELVGAD